MWDKITIDGFYSLYTNVEHGTQEVWFPAYRCHCSPEPKCETKSLLINSEMEHKRSGFLRRCHCSQSLKMLDKLTIELMHCKDKKPKFRNKYSHNRKSGVSVPISTIHIHASVSNLYILTIGLPILLEEICRPILGLYKSLTDTWMLKLGLRPRYSQKRNT